MHQTEDTEIRRDSSVAKIWMNSYRLTREPWGYSWVFKLLWGRLVDEEPIAIRPSHVPSILSEQS